MTVLIGRTLADIKYKLLKWAVWFYCWPYRSGRVMVTFDRDRPFTLITGHTPINADTVAAIGDHFIADEDDNG